MDAPEAVPQTVTKDASRPGTEVSEAIRVARVVCIFFMIFVHVNPGTAQFSSTLHGIRAFDAVRFFLVDSLGRASVALLSVVAGYLAVFSLRRESYGVFLHKKVKSLALPMVVWNVVFLAMVVLGSTLSAGYVEQSFGGDITLSRLPDLLLGLDGLPANEPLAFLRDVFICALLTPVLLMEVRRSIRLYVVTVTALGLLGVFTAFLMTPSILVLYACGIYFADRGRVPMPDRRLTVVAFLAFVLVGAVLSWRDMTSNEHAAGALTWLEGGFNLIRIPAAIAFWSLALRLQPTRIGAQIAKLEPYVFIAFCGHLILTTMVWAVWQRVFGDYYGAAYPVFFFALPVVVMTAAVIGSRLANTRTPWLFSVLNGGRNLATSTRGKRAVIVGSPTILTAEAAP